MVVTTPRLETRFKALLHPHRVRALDAFAEPRGRVATTSEIAHEIGVPVDQLSYHVRELVKYGWLELVEKREGKKGVAIERLYCVVQHPQYDTETFVALPPSGRRTIIDHGVGLVMADLAAASDVGTLGTGLDEHFSRTPIVVDERGWEDLVERVMAIFTDAETIAGEALNRVASGEASGSELIPTRHCLFLFPSAPYRTYPRVQQSAPGAWRSFPAVPPEPGLGRTLKLLTHPLRVKAFNLLAASPGLVATSSEIARDIGIRLVNAAYHLRTLEAHGWIEAVEDETETEDEAASGYRAVEIAAGYDSPAWAMLTSVERKFVTEQVVGLIMAELVAAADAGKLDARPDFHLSRNPLMLDTRGWHEVAGKMVALMHHAQATTASSAARVASGELAPSELFPARLAMLLFKRAPPAQH